MFWRTEKSLVPTGIRITDRPAGTLNNVLTELCQLPKDTDSNNNNNNNNSAISTVGSVSVRTKPLNVLEKMKQNSTHSRSLKSSDP